MIARFAGAMLLSMAAWAAPVLAASLQVSPILLEVKGAATTLNLSNTGNEIVQAQIRVVKWSQEKGRDELVPTRDVVASPPAVKIAPGADYVVRIVRVAKTPLAAEEPYRVLVDQLPSPAKKKAGNNINFLMRYSIPAFFGEGGDEAALEWKALTAGGKLAIMASNPGSRRLKISALKVSGPSGSIVNTGDGLTGYVLGGATNALVTVPAKGIKPGMKIAIAARTEKGPIEGHATVSAP